MTKKKGKMKKRKKKSAANASGMKTIKRNIMNDKAGHTIFSCSRYIVYLSAAIIAGIYLAGVRIARWNE